MPDPTRLSEHARNVLRLLRDEHNVLISGAPGTGKTRLLSEVQRVFRNPAGAVYRPGAAGALIRREAVPEDWLPSPGRASREVFPTVFDPQTKYRDFLRGLVTVPSVAGAGSGGVQFRVSRGTLYRANQHARSDGGTALVVIDEINRGPAVQVFGASIVAIESDKRLNGDNTPGEGTATFELLDDDGDPINYALSPHLYLLGAMNQADTSVEPLDVAFQRRWSPYRLHPDPDVLRIHFGFGMPLWEVRPDDLPEDATAPEHVYLAAVKAWEAVNRRIVLGRGRDLQIGHGVLLDHGMDPPAGSVAEAADSVRKGWAKIRAHIDEVFFGDLRGVAAALGVRRGDGHPYILHDRMFASQPALDLEEPPLTDALLYRLLRAVASGE